MSEGKISMNDLVDIFSSSDPEAIATSIKLLLLLTVLSYHQQF